MKREEINALLDDFLEVKLDDKAEERLKAHFATGGQSEDRFFEEYFDYLLDFEEQRKAPSQPAGGKHLSIDSSNWYRWAAAVLLLLVGFLAGRSFDGAVTGSTGEEMTVLRDDLNSLRKEMVMMQIGQPMASDRIRAVQYAESIASEDVEVINVLGKVLISDDDVNVRLAAAYALFGFADVPEARERLIFAIDHESQETLVQLSLINMMLSLREKSAISNIRRALSNEAIPDEELTRIETKLTEWL